MTKMREDAELRLRPDLVDVVVAGYTEHTNTGDVFNYHLEGAGCGRLERTGPVAHKGFLLSSRVVLTKVAFSQGDILDTSPFFHCLHGQKRARAREMPFTSVSAKWGLHARRSDLYFLSPSPSVRRLCLCLSHFSHSHPCRAGNLF